MQVSALPLQGRQVACDIAMCVACDIAMCVACDIASPDFEVAVTVSKDTKEAT